MQDKEFVLDTSFISSLLDASDVNHDQAQIVATNLPAKSRLLIPSVVIAELATYNRDKKQSKHNVEVAIDMATEIIDFRKQEIEKYKGLIFPLKTSVTAVDSIILYLAHKLNATLITFDKKLENLFREVQAK